MLPLHSVLSLHVNGGKTFTEQTVTPSISPSPRSSDFLSFFLFFSSNTLYKLASFTPFHQFSFSFSFNEHKIQLITREWYAAGGKAGRDGVWFNKKLRVRTWRAQRETETKQEEDARADISSRCRGNSAYRWRINGGNHWSGEKQSLRGCK